AEEVQFVGGDHAPQDRRAASSPQTKEMKIVSDLPMLDLRRLSVFREVETRRSFSAAALALSYTQSSGSQTVADLDAELGVTLLDGWSRRVRTAPAGELVLGHAEALIGQANAIEADLAALTAGDTGRLRLGGFATAWATFLPAAVAAFTADHPQVELLV